MYNPNCTASHDPIEWTLFDSSYPSWPFNAYDKLARATSWIHVRRRTSCDRLIPSRSLGPFPALPGPSRGVPVAGKLQCTQNMDWSHVNINPISILPQALDLDWYGLIRTQSCTAMAKYGKQTTPGRCALSQSPPKSMAHADHTMRCAPDDYPNVGPSDRRAYASAPLGLYKTLPIIQYELFALSAHTIPRTLLNWSVWLSRVLMEKNNEKSPTKLPSKLTKGSRSEPTAKWHPPVFSMGTPHCGHCFLQQQWRWANFHHRFCHLDHLQWGCAPTNLQISAKPSTPEITAACCEWYCCSMLGFILFSCIWDEFFGMLAMNICQLFSDSWELGSWSWWFIPFRMMSTKSQHQNSHRHRRHHLHHHHHRHHHHRHHHHPHRHDRHHQNPSLHPKRCSIWHIRKGALGIEPIQEASRCTIPKLCVRVCIYIYYISCVLKEPGQKEPRQISRILRMERKMICRYFSLNVPDLPLFVLNLLLFFLILLLFFEGNRHHEMNPKSGFVMLYEHSLAAQVSQLKEWSNMATGGCFELVYAIRTCYVLKELPWNIHMTSFLGFPLFGTYSTHCYPNIRNLSTISDFSDHQVAAVERSRCQAARHLGRFATRGRHNLAHLGNGAAANPVGKSPSEMTVVLSG